MQERVKDQMHHLCNCEVLLTKYCKILLNENSNIVPNAMLFRETTNSDKYPLGVKSLLFTVYTHTLTTTTTTTAANQQTNC